MKKRNDLGLKYYDFINEQYDLIYKKLNNNFLNIPINEESLDINFASDRNQKYFNEMSAHDEWSDF